jgi:hypothetical protein
MAKLFNTVVHWYDVDASPAFDPGTDRGGIAGITGTSILWFHTTGTTWSRVNLGALSAADGNDVPIVRADAVTNVAPTVAEIPLTNIVDGDTASIFLTDGKLEKWVRVSGVWTLAYTLTSDKVSNLANGTATATEAPVTNSNGTGFSLPVATTTTAGIMSAAQVTQLADILADVTNLQTLSGLADGSTNGGTYTGNIIPDNVSLKAATQALETALQNLIPTNTVYASQALAETALTVGSGKAYWLAGNNPDGLSSAGTKGPVFYA